MITGKIIISGAGCALADFLYNGISFDQENFRKYQSQNLGDGGLSPGKLVFTEELEQYAAKSYQEILKDVIGGNKPDTVNVGGPSLVSLIHASQLLGYPNYQIKYFGISGNDETSDNIFRLLLQTHLNVRHYKKSSSKPTPFTHVLSDPDFDNGQGERTFINNIGAAEDFLPEMLTSDFFDSQIVCFGGTALVPKLHENLTALVRKAKSKSCITVVNTVFDFQSEKNNPGQPWRLVDGPDDYGFIDVLIMDSEEAIRISGKNTIEEAAFYFSNTKVSSFIITNGANELLAWSSGRLFKKTEILRLPVSQKIANELKSNPTCKGDTTGCGDNFAGGIIASLAWQLRDHEKSQFELLETVSWGVASGGFSCFIVGGTYLEKFSGEKKNAIQPIQIEYLKQIQSK